MLTFMKLCCLVIMEAFAAVIFLEAVSYTHLTLPTSYGV